MLPDVVARLRAAGIAVEEFSLHLPSLDEVFFTLTGTGRRATHATASGGDGMTAVAFDSPAGPPARPARIRLLHARWCSPSAT